MASSVTSQNPNVTVQGVFNSTVELIRRCEDVYQQLDEMCPQEQVECVNAIGLSAISKQLKTIKNFINSIQFNQRCAVQVLYLYDSISEIFEKQRYNPNKMAELQFIVNQLISKPRINECNKLALQSIEETLNAVEESHIPSVISSNESKEESESDSSCDTDPSSSKSVSQELETPIDSPRQTEEFDPDDPFLIIQEITNLIMQMQASSEISPEDKKEMTKTVLALLNESPAIESAPLHPPVNAPSIIHGVEKKIDATQELQNLLLLFQNSSSQDHKDLLLAFESKKFKLPITGNPSVDVVGHIYFHLYFIHKKKSQDNKLLQDLDYGKNAMMGIYPTTHDECIRAIMRTITEFALQKLEDAVNANQFEDVNIALSTLEGLKMSPSDMPKEQNNLAHALFGAMYNKHVEARKSKTWLVDPRDWKFRRDFGRKAFSMSDGIDAVDKIAVIRGLLQELKKVWQTP